MTHDELVRWSYNEFVKLKEEIPMIPSKERREAWDRYAVAAISLIPTWRNTADAVANAKSFADALLAARDKTFTEE